MTSWRKHFTVYDNKSNSGNKNGKDGYTSRFQSWLPEVYTGMPNRTERYMQYDQMDMDSEINMALDTMAEFATQMDEETQTPFNIAYKDTPTESEAKILKQALKQWGNINDWDRRIFKTFRNVIKYGDQPFVRDPETWQLMFVNPQDVLGVVINESKGKVPEQYIIKNLDLNLQNKTATTPINMSKTTAGISNSTFTTMTGRTATNTNYSSAQAAQSNTLEQFHVGADNIVHVALTEGMDANYPFGTSILDPIFKTYKQKELLEDAIIIYRVQRAPERRVFYIDTGDMPPHRAASFLEKVKMEVHQKRIPNKTGGGNNIMDAQYNPLCLALDTKIPLLDGRTLELNELITEYQSGKENWAYSCDPDTGKIVPGVITWAGITRKDTDVIKLTFDNGASLTVTPDHKIPVFGKGFVEAKDLTPSDSLISFETKQAKLPSSKNKTTYTQVYDHADNEWVFVHRMVGEYFRKLGKHQEFTYIIEGNKNIVHHKDFNRHNNDPKNLQWMNKEDHFRFHGDSNFWANVTPEEAQSVKDKIKNTLTERWKNLSNEDRVDALDNILTAQKKAVLLRKTCEKTKEKYSKTMRAVRMKFLEDNPNFIKDVLLPNAKTYAENYPNQAKVYSFRMIQIIAETVKFYNSNKKQTIELLANNEEFLEEIRKNNPIDPKKNNKINYDTVTMESFERTLFHFGYKGWKDFKEKLAVFNHRITGIEYLSEKQDTGTITIDGKEKWHNYHTFATECGIFVKNSILEDFFFAQGSDGRGSKVEVLPGGDNLGEISDLKFFTDKMMRGLRIPSSYMPMAADDNGATYTDGRVGTAFIQEFRFNKYCMRLQSIIQPVFDREFKRFLKNRGFNIDAAMFDIRFNEPQSFGEYRQIELDGAKAGIFGQLEGSRYLSRRFILKKYLGLSESEILENEQMYLEENPKGKTKPSDFGNQIGLGDVGIRGGFDDFNPDIGGEEMGDTISPEGDNLGSASPLGGGQGGGNTATPPAGGPQGGNI